MRVDVHAHCIQPEHVTAAAHSKMERSGYPPMEPMEFDYFMREMEPVDKAICFGVRARGTGTMTPDEYTSEWVSRAPEKLLGFMAIDPMEEDYLEKIDRAASELGLCGIKLHPILGRYNPADPKIFPLYEKAIDLGLPILTHMGAHPDDRVSLKQSEPLLFDDVAQAFGELKIVIAHMAHPVAAGLRGAVAKAPERVRRRVRRRLGAAVAGMASAHADGRMGSRGQAAVWVRFSVLDAPGGIRQAAALERSGRGDGLSANPGRRAIEGIINRDALGLLGIA